MFVHVTATSFKMIPEEDAPNEIDLRVVSVAAFAVPAEPGSPVCNLIYGKVTEYAVLLPNAFKNELHNSALAPTAI
jgi:hypothetical protein